MLWELQYTAIYTIFKVMFLFEKSYKKQKIVENYVDISMYTSQIKMLIFFASGILELAFLKNYNIE